MCQDFLTEIYKSIFNSFLRQYNNSDKIIRPELTWNKVFLYLTTKYRGAQLIRTMEIGKKPYELANSYKLAATCMSNFLTKLWIFHPEFLIISENKDFTKLMSTF